uniref:Uncharacterized protein n=1 Tax=Clostridium perfringens TaxID=1502 RepID=Q5DWD0_CLOPF|nr:hypothetical protein [Clostridium perfringens]
MLNACYSNHSFVDFVASTVSVQTIAENLTKKPFGDLLLFLLNFNFFT